MTLSLRCRYALRAVLELSRRQGKGLVRIAEIARIQRIPLRFLEAILVDLKKAGVVSSARGKTGGYVLRIAPSQVTVGQVIRLIDGPVTLADPGAVDPRRGNRDEPDVLLAVWERSQQAIGEVLDRETFQDLLDEEAARADTYVPTYSI